MKLEKIILCEVSKRPKDRHCIFSLIGGPSPKSLEVSRYARITVKQSNIKREPLSGIIREYHGIWKVRTGPCCNGKEINTEGE